VKTWLLCLCFISSAVIATGVHAQPFFSRDSDDVSRDRTTVPLKITDVVDPMLELPDEIVSEVADFAKECKPFDVSNKFAKPGKISADTQTMYYYILNFRNSTCGDNGVYFCGATGNCSQMVFVTESPSIKYKVALDDSALWVSVNATHNYFYVTIRRHDTDCQGHKPGEACLEHWKWNGQEFAPP
jgi:hypothetical protein